MSGLSLAKSRLVYVSSVAVLYGLFMTFFSVAEDYYAHRDHVLVALHKAKREQMAKHPERFESKLGSREIASIPFSNSVVSNGGEKRDLTELSEFYFSRYRELLAAGQSKQAIRTLSRIQKNSTDLDVQMKSTYFKALHFCQKSEEKKCLKEVDYMVTQSPDSVWTGKALVGLAEHYLKINRLPEVLLLKDVVKLQFKESKVVMTELNKLKL